MKFSKVILISGSNVLFLVGAISLVSRDKAPHGPLVYPAHVAEIILGQTGEDIISADALVTDVVPDKPAHNPDFPRSAPEQPAEPDGTEAIASVDTHDETLPVALTPAPLELAPVVELPEKVQPQPEEMSVLGSGVVKATMDRSSGFLVSMGAEGDGSGDEVAAWPLFGNEYRAHDFPGYCQVVAYAMTPGDDYLWSPALTQMREGGLQAIQAVLADPMARGSVVDHAGAEQVFAWVVCMDEQGNSGKPFKTPEALARLDGVTLGPASSILATAGE